ncbi:ATP-binding protein [Aurantiacibacter suaedae]|uniref:ATP-binding protein n=1 Tax=Aurantiacibacter suaedae TaxID=2545755 RepID=UPI0010F79AF3|nr:ATP-binding protein [Aurantiacibacter suaedae]
MTDPESSQVETANTTPAKTFFVSMLTRDIELDDAILDLLDNCIDGVIRSEPNEGEKPYDGYEAVLRLSPERFELEDNCGGIPYQIAKTRAFRLGRPPSTDPADGHRTVGVYGIGMKRAIFKLGNDSSVVSYGDRPFRVDIEPDWLNSDEWKPLELQAIELPEGAASGTTITVEDLNPGIASKLGEAAWIEDLRQYISDHYAIIISKGFSVRIEAKGISKDPITPAPFYLAVSGELGGDGVQPFVYRGTFEGVTVEVYAGLLAPPLREDELSERQGEQEGRSQAGWTIACNDRVVVSKDRTYLTGWGTAGVPSYHGQYTVVSGIALLSSDNVSELPLTTTKRGLDASTIVYAKLLDVMREATKKLTSFTNSWKTKEARREPLGEVKPCSLAMLREFDGTKSVTSGQFKGLEVFRPELPKPPSTSRLSQVSFAAEKSEIDALREYFEDPELKTGEVGRLAFEEVLADAGFVAR